MWLQRCLHYKGNIPVKSALVTQVAFKNCVSFTKCIKKIHGTTTDNAKDWDLVMPIYNLKEHSWNYSETTESLWFHSKDEAGNFDNNIANSDNFKSSTKLNY